ncbi:hypothetical protein L2E82_25909 [Cichorium intybus]|uniref:Uncharacterized protein n=1 Tax=Cichorium intybus TaxID=13427 RepID=A0ACB9E5B1_CICIN|nr:hypothetical protein L2E82_25909 [Cichorium intybus]
MSTTLNGHTKAVYALYWSKTDQNAIISYERIAWLKITGIPLNAWGGENFGKIAEKIQESLDNGGLYVESVGPCICDDSQESEDEEMIDEYDDGHGEDAKLTRSRHGGEAPVDTLTKVTEKSNSNVCFGDYVDSTNGMTGIEGTHLGLGKTGETFTVGKNLFLMHNEHGHGTSEQSLGPIG